MATKARRIPDSERTTIMRAALHSKWGKTAQGDSTRRHAVIEQVPHATGFDTGFSDVCVMNLWQSDRYRIIGYELKASRGDLKRELAKPEKSARVRALCDEWWVLVWSNDIIKGLEDQIPAAWGIAVMRPDDDDEDTTYQIRTHRKPGTMRLVPEPTLPRPFVAAMVRRALEHAPAAAYVADIVRSSTHRARWQALEEGKDKGRAEAWQHVREALGTLAVVKAGDAPTPGAWGRYSEASALEANVDLIRLRLAEAEVMKADIESLRRQLQARENEPIATKG